MNDEQLITLYLDGELDHEDSEALEARLEVEPELMSALEEQLALSLSLERASEYEGSQLSLDGFTERVMGALPEGLYTSEVTPTARVEARSEARAERPGLLGWLTEHITPLLIGAAVAAALLLSLQRSQAPETSAPGGPARSTVLINLDEAQREGSAPVIWVLDEAEEAGGAEGGGADDPI